MARNQKTNSRGLNSFWIRIIGIASMIWSFLTASDIAGIRNLALSDCMLWFSYTIFAFLLVEGVNNTSNRLLYFRRFIVFTVLSEFAYDLYRFGTFFNMEGQSIMLTLLICLAIMFICDYFKRRFRNLVLDIILIVALSIAFRDTDTTSYGQATAKCRNHRRHLRQTGNRRNSACTDVRCHQRIHNLKDLLHSLIQRQRSADGKQRMER